VPDLDESDTGIQGRISTMQELLEKHDPELKDHLDELGIDASFYAIRWWTTLLSREFLLPDTIRLWDSMFASTHKDNFLRYVCVTMVLLIRSELLKGDFSTCLRMLQSYPSTHMDRLLESSRALWIYESQITVACHKGGLSLHQAVQAITPPPALIMAFGLRNKNGSLVSLDDDGMFSPPTGLTREQLEQAKGIAAEKLRNSSQAVAASTRVFFGKAKGWASKYSQEYAAKRRQHQQMQQQQLHHQQQADPTNLPPSSLSTATTPPLYETGKVVDSGGGEVDTLRTLASAAPPPPQELSEPGDDDNVYLDAILNS